MATPFKVPSVTTKEVPTESKPIINTKNKENNSQTRKNKMSITALVGKKVSKKVKFMNEDVTISKLSYQEVMDIQEKAKAVGEDESQGFEVLKVVIRSGVEGGSELDDAAFAGFPMEELSKLSQEIMKYSGIGGDSAGK